LRVVEDMVFLTKTAKLAEFTYERTPIGALTLEQQQIMRGITAQVSGTQVKNEPPKLPTLGELLLDNISRVGLPINDNGLVTLEEWREAISELGLRAEQQETDAVFKAIDADGSGAVDPAELQDLLWHGLMEPEKQEEVDRGKFVRKKIRVTPSESESGSRFAGTKDPTVTLTEVLPKLRSFLDQRRERLTDLFHNWDVNDDGFVVLSELIKGLQNMGAELSTAECRTLFDVFDGNLDGKVDAGEFAHVLHTARSGAAMAALQLRTLKRMGLGFDAPRVRALQGASAHAAASALGRRYEGDGEPLTAEEELQYFVLTEADELRDLERQLGAGRVLPPVQLQRFRDLAFSVDSTLRTSGSSLVPADPEGSTQEWEAAARVPAALARPQPVWLLAAPERRASAAIWSSNPNPDPDPDPDSDPDPDPNPDPTLTSTLT
jgi:Ca2+-binding EF-hand superfamily protein